MFAVLSGIDEDWLKSGFVASVSIVKNDIKLSYHLILKVKIFLEV